MKIKIGDHIPGLYPSTYTSQEIEADKQLRRRKRRPWEHSPVDNRVEYIHPKRRYAVVRFLFDAGSFCEAFTLRGCEL